MNWLIRLVAKVALGKKLMSAVGFVHDKLDGRKSEIVLGVYALVHGLKVVGLVPPESAAKVEEILLPLLPVVLADRASKVVKQLDGVLH